MGEIEAEFGDLGNTEILSLSMRNAPKSEKDAEEFDRQKYLENAEKNEEALYELIDAMSNPDNPNYFGRSQ